MGSSQQRFSVVHWAAVLGFALLLPVHLPVGGAERRQPDLRRRQGLQEPLLSLRSTALRTAPRHHAPALSAVMPDTPLRLLRSWSDPHGLPWLQVQGVDQRTGSSMRGWVESSLAG